MIFGINNDRSITSDPKAAVGAYGHRLIAESGFGAVRYCLYLCFVNPKPGVWDFALPDIEIKAALDAGLDVFVSLMWAPPHASAGKPTYMPFTGGCSVVEDTADGSIGVRFASERDYCSSPPSIDADWLRDITTRVVSRYAAMGVKFFGGWNEGNDRIFYPPRKADGSFDAERYVNEIVKPFTEAARKIPNIWLVGPEMYDAAAAKAVLALEKMSGDVWFDVLSFHAYGKVDGVEEAIRNILVFREAFGGDPRLLWLSETGLRPHRASIDGLLDQAEEIGEYIRALDAFEQSVDRVYLYRIKRDAGPMADYGLLLSDGTPSPALSATRSILRELEVPFGEVLGRGEYVPLQPFLRDCVVYFGTGPDSDVRFLIVKKGDEVPTQAFQILRVL